MTRALVAAALLAASVAHADPSKRVVAILDVHVEGIPPEARTQFEQRLDQQIDTSRFWIAGAKSTHDHLAASTSWTEGCVVGACLSEVRTQAGAELALLATLTGSGTSFGYVVTLVRTDTGNVLAQKAVRCDVCTVTDAINGASAAVSALLAEVPSRLPDERADHQAALAIAEGRRDAIAHARRRHLGLALGGTGLAVAAAGAAWFFADHHAAGGAAVAGAGAGLVLGGAVVLRF